MTEEFERFKLLLDEWHKKAAIYSSHFQMMKHENFKKILEMDKDNVIGYACLLIKQHVHLCLILLDHLVSEDKRPPFDSYYAGRIPVIVECWKYWALKEKIIFRKHDVNAYWEEDKFGNDNKGITEEI